MERELLPKRLADLKRGVSIRLQDNIGAAVSFPSVQFSIGSYPPSSLCRLCVFRNLLSLAHRCNVHNDKLDRIVLLIQRELKCLMRSFSIASSLFFVSKTYLIVHSEPVSNQPLRPCTRILYAFAVILLSRSMYTKTQKELPVSSAIKAETPPCTTRLDEVLLGLQTTITCHPP